MITLILYEILIIFTFTAVGFFAYKVKFLTTASTEHLTKLMINIACPCMLITSITSNQVTDSMLRAVAQMLIGTAVFFLAGIFVASAFLKWIGVPKVDSGVYNMMITTQNSGFMGFPLAKGIFGSQGLFFMVLSNLVMNIYMYTVGLLQINMGGKKEKRHWKQSLKALCNPCSVAAAIGLVLLLLHVELPPFAKEIMEPLGDITIPVSMVVLGVQMGSSQFSQIIKNKKLALVTFVSLVIWPALTFLAVNWLPLYQYVKIIMVYVAGLPSMVMLVSLAEDEGQNAKAAAEGVTYSTVCSMLTLPILTICLKTYYGV